jgi:hypothetical protein
MLGGGRERLLENHTAPLVVVGKEKGHKLQTHTPRKL